MTMNESKSPDVQADLMDDPTGQRRAAMVARLKGLHVDCLAAKRKPCDRKTFDQLEASTTALAAAIRIVETLPPQQGGRN